MADKASAATLFRTDVMDAAKLVDRLSADFLLLRDAPILLLRDCGDVLFLFVIFKTRDTNAKVAVFFIHLSLMLLI